MIEALRGEFMRQPGEVIGLHKGGLGRVDVLCVHGCNVSLYLLEGYGKLVLLATRPIIR